MKVIFLEDVEGTAQVGDVKEVKNGFARNYLLPRRLAAPAVEPYLARAQARAAREAKRQGEIDMEASAVAERLEGTRITITARVGEQGKLYGSVTSVHIAEEVAKLVGGEEEFDHRKVLLPEAIKEVGLQPVRLRLTRNVEAAIEVEVIAEGEPEEAVVEQPEAAEEEAEAGQEEAEPEAELAAEEKTEAEAEPGTEADEAEVTPDEQPEADLEEAGSEEAEAADETEEEEPA